MNDEMPTLSDKELIHWLWAKYRRHGEIEDGAAAERLESLLAENTSLQNRLDLAMNLLDELGCDNKFYADRAKELLDSVSTRREHPMNEGVRVNNEIEKDELGFPASTRHDPLKDNPQSGQYDPGDKDLGR